MEKKVIHEVILKKKNQRLNREKLNEKFKNNIILKQKRKRELNNYFSAQKLVKDYREMQKSYSSYKNKINNPKYLTYNYDLNYEKKPIILIRICGLWSRIPKEIKSILIKLNLKDLYTAIILYYNKNTLKIIKLIENYITWGYIKKSKIEALLKKRGSINNTGNVKQNNLLDNNNIEESLGKFGVFCIEDLIHELSYQGKYYKEILKYIGYFQLENKDNGFEKANINFNKGGNQGFRGEKINNLLEEMI